MSRATLCAARLPVWVHPRLVLYDTRAGGGDTVKALEQKEQEFLSQERKKKKLRKNRGSQQGVSLSPRNTFFMDNGRVLATGQHASYSS